jgi:hypothetical protein
MTKVKSLIFQNIKLVMVLLFGACIVSVFVYVLAVNMTVRNVAKRQAMETELSRLGTKLSELEFQYIRQKNSITLDYAKKLGFVSAIETKFVSRKTSVAMADILSSDIIAETR